jgi:hypothetical protein
MMPDPGRQNNDVSRWNQLEMAGDLRSEWCPITRVSW